MAQRKEVSIQYIADLCGVSIATVSRVLNHHPDVSEEVRQRVLDEVERCAYIPNNSARDLVRTRSDAIGVIVRGNGNLFFSSVLKTVSDEIERYGYTMVLHYIGSDADEVKAGRKFILFPEGGYNHNGNQLQDFKPGAFKAAVWAGKPIVPVAVVDSYKLFDINSLKRVTTQVHFLEPLYYEDYRYLNTKEISERVKEAIREAIEKATS